MGVMWLLVKLRMKYLPLLNLKHLILSLFLFSNTITSEECTLPLNPGIYKSLKKFVLSWFLNQNQHQQDPMPWFSGATRTSSFPTFQKAHSMAFPAEKAYSAPGVMSPDSAIFHAPFYFGILCWDFCFSKSLIVHSKIKVSLSWPN